MWTCPMSPLAGKFVIASRGEHPRATSASRRHPNESGGLFLPCHRLSGVGASDSVEGAALAELLRNSGPLTVITRREIASRLGVDRPEERIQRWRVGDIREGAPGGTYADKRGSLVLTPLPAHFAYNNPIRAGSPLSSKFAPSARPSAHG